MPQIHKKSTISPQFTAGQLVLQALEAGYRAEKPRKYIGISQLPYCEKKLFKQATRKEKTELTDQVLLSFLTGSATHEKLQNLLRKHRGSLPFKYKRAEKKVRIATPAGNTLKGHADLIAEIDDKEIVIDFKIVNENKFRYTDKPDFHYKDQLMLYAYGLGLQHCQLCYLCKNSGKQITFAFPVDFSRIQVLLKKYDALLEAIEHERLPEKPFKSENETWQCRYCQYSRECWGFIEIEKDEKEIAVIPSNTEIKYLKLLKEREEIEEQINEIKCKIIVDADGKDALGAQLRASYIQPAEMISYDKKKLEKMFPLESLKPCQRITRKKGYYRFSERKSS